MENLENEVWKEVPGYPRYLASNKGRVLGKRRYLINSLGKVINRKERLVKQLVDQDGYFSVTLFNKGEKGKKMGAHRVIAKAFLENPENKPQVNHKNSNRQDNNVENLEWCTQGENMKHGFMYGNKTQKGEKNNQAKITMDKVNEIRKYHQQNPSVRDKEIGKVFGLDRRHINDIVNKRIWNY